ncbi:MAG TPA: AroM family protein [Ramlibacter sp.]|nr:AroM family protein [Ramlibacter sp.]
MSNVNAKPIRIGFATIGQAPRSDSVPAIVAALGQPVEVIEAGGLDGLSDEQIAQLGPREGEYTFATRLADGRQVVLGKSAAEARLVPVLERMDQQNLDLVVALCAGTSLPALKNSLLIEPQRIVDGITAGLAAACRRIGIVVPLAQQVERFHLEGEVTAQVRVTHASPYEGDRFFEAGRELADCDLVVMHCMGYTADMRAKVASGAGVPTVSAPELVAAVLRQLIERPRTTTAPASLPAND